MESTHLFKSILTTSLVCVCLCFLENPLFGQNKARVDSAYAELLRLGEIEAPSISNEPFLDAVERGDLIVAQLFIQLGMDVNIADSWKRLPLFSAVENGDLNMVKLLLGSGADINLRDKHRRTVFIVAANKGHADVLLYLQTAKEAQVKN